MKKRIKSAVALLLCLAICAGMLVLSSCTAATEKDTLVFTNASGAGTLTTCVSIPVSGNEAYVKDAKALAEALQAHTNELTSTRDVYTVSYTGKVGSNETISLSFSFTDINDYNKKMMRLYKLVPLSAHNLLGAPAEYELASWTLTDKGSGSYTAAFSQSSAMIATVNQWAYRWLLKHDVDGAWDYTGDGNYAQYGPFNPTATILDSTNQQLTVTVGSTSKTVSEFSGNKPVTVSASGTVSGTPVTVDKSVTDKDLIVEWPSTEPEKPVIPYRELTKTDISLNLPTGRKVKVACVGDSITHGADDYGYPAYPKYLQDILGSNFEVENFGVGGTRLISSDGNGSAYTKCDKYKPGHDFNPDVVIIMLGTNDSSDYTFKRFEQYFKSDYQALIDSYKDLPSKPYVIVATSPYIVATEGSSSARVNDYIVPRQRQIFEELDGVDGEVDIWSWSKDRYYLYKDGVHYNPNGYYSMALKFAEEIFGIANGYHTVTVNTVPGAIVSLDKQGTGSVKYTHDAVADETGKAVCYGQDGTYTLTVRADNYAKVTKTVTLTGDTTVTPEMKAGDYNVAYLRPVTASTESDEGGLASFANDDDPATHWTPKESDAETSYLIFDLGAKKEIHGIRLTSWFQAYASGYNVQVSDDGVNFKKVATISGANAPGLDEHDFASASGRYVKVAFTKKGYFYNFEIYDLQLLSNDLPTSAGTKGDVDGDSDIDASDLTALARHVGKIEEITVPQLLLNADLDGSGGIDASDLTKLARIVGKIE